MAALVCEFCGGSLITKAGGICECDSCGMQFDKTWVKEKIQEIRGTVTVEGTVEVQGTVKVDGPVKVEGGVNIESLLKRGWLALEDKKWDDAEKFFDEALNLDAESGDAYLGKACSQWEVSDIGEFLQEANHTFEEIEANSDFQKALRFSDKAVVEMLQEKIAVIKQHFQQSSQGLLAVQKKIAPAQGMIAVTTGNDLIVGLKSDGTLLTAGRAHDGEDHVKEWYDIIRVAAGRNHVVGLKSDGTVVAAGDNDKGQCNVSEWQDIVNISAGDNHTVGLKSNGTVVAVGWENGNRTKVEDWRDIIAISAGHAHTVGLRSNGTVLATGLGQFGQCDVDGWDNIVAIGAGAWCTIGLKTNGKVVVAGKGDSICDVEEWHDMVAIAVGHNNTLGLQSDGDVLNVGSKRSTKTWHNMVAVATGFLHSVGVKEDGTVVAVGNSTWLTDSVGSWKLFNSLETIEQERAEARVRRIETERIEAERRAEEARLEAERKAKERAELKAALESEKTALTTELSNLKGMFSGKRRKEIEARLAELDAELKNL